MFDFILEYPDVVLAALLRHAQMTVTALLIALVLIQFYPLSTARMREIREQLEARRGAV